MRILVVNEYAGKLGGVEQYLANVVPALRRRGHQLGLLYERLAPRDGAEFLEQFDGHYQNLDSALAQFPADVLFLHRVSSIRPFLGLPQACVRYIHDHDVCCPRRHKYYLWNGRACQHKADWRCWLDLAFVRRDRKRPLGLAWVSLAEHQQELQAHRRLSGMLVGSRAMREELAQNGLPDAQVVPPLIPWEEQAVSQSSLPRILYVGQLIRGKGVDLLISALAGLPGEWTARLVGDGNARPALQRKINRLHLQDRVQLVGWVSPQELHRHYQEARLVVVPSRWPEPFGMVGLEAMKFARPVVGFDIGGIPDWLEHGKTGWLVPAGDSRALTVAIRHLLERPDLCDQLGRQGQARLRESFAFEPMIARLEEVLEKASG